MAAADAVRFTLGDGTAGVIRPIRTDEGPALLAALQRLAPESRVRRFLYDKRSFTEKELHELTHCDGINHIALVAAVLDAEGRRWSRSPSRAPSAVGRRAIPRRRRL